MALNTIWFILIGVLFTGFFFLEGFDYGVGILLPFLGKDDRERRLMINSIGPHWDANEVWLIAAGGAMFAAFPHWYATLFSGFYIALVLMLLALIVRGVAFEFRSKSEGARWRSTWDWAICIGSAIPALLWGVAMANIVRGVPIDANMQYVGTFGDLLNPFALVAGVTSLLLFTLHGANFLTIKIEGAVTARAESLALRLWPVVIIFGLIVSVMGYFETDVVSRLGYFILIIPLAAIVAIGSVGWLIRRKRMGWAFVMAGACIVLFTLSMFVGLYPRVMTSSLQPDAWSLTIENASSSPYTLRVMSIVALIFLPIVLLYQAWSYRVFRRRLTSTSSLEY
ncbi:MAG: cytochrome d ubiquinol oxidase subunit II [Anaerolineales bacterium]|jgi:cytochrome d ubiquinol oxidase subunit II